MRVCVILLLLMGSVVAKRTPKTWLVSLAMSDCKTCFANVPSHGYMWFFDSVFGMVCTNTSVFTPEYAVSYSCYWSQCQEIEFCPFEDEDPVVACDSGEPVTATEEPIDWIVLRKNGYINNVSAPIPMEKPNNAQINRKGVGMNPRLAGVWQW